ncbi:MAG TPA: lipopolysaccharide assembly protein LapA domain-containing protein [Rhodanobacteraceae bacterium]|nr:lipopolysaccharide assembly protein LapA domain-containing protein [Rhodanobacteraceae bacterium]
MRALTVVLVVLFLILGALFGALNPQPVVYDFLFARMEVSKGAALLVAMLLGWLLGGALCWAGSGFARQRKLVFSRRPREKA